MRIFSGSETCSDSYQLMILLFIYRPMLPAKHILGGSRFLLTPPPQVPPRVCLADKGRCGFFKNTFVLNVNIYMLLK